MLTVIPTPMHIEKVRGMLDLSGISLFLTDCTDKRVIRAAATLCKEAEAVTEERIKLSCACPTGKSIIISHGAERKEGSQKLCTPNADGEGYRLIINENGIKIEANGAAGAFYGIQSLRQLIKENGKSLPFCKIEDAPEFGYRGFYHDITRGRVPTLKKLKEIADILSYFKINSMQLYVEDAFTFKELEGIVSADAALTPSEILELDSYCRDRFIELIPSLSTFGHLYTLLQSESYKYICELEGYEPSRNYWMEKQWHHTVDVYNPDTIKVIGSLLEQYIPLFSSNYFNICCDETMDLCRGKNEGRDKGEAYFRHVEKLIEIVRSHGKTVMMWGDECMARPELSKEKLPNDTIILNWCYRKEVNEWIPKFFHELGFPQIACTGTSCWDNFIENVDVSVGNISSFSAHAKKYGALGILNTNWGDFGHVCSFNCNLYGLLFGAEKSWNPDSETEGGFEAAASLLLYGVTSFNMIDTVRTLSKAAYTCSWFDYVMWHSAVCLEGKEAELKYAPWGDFDEDKIKCSLEKCRTELEMLISLDRNDPVICDLILASRALILMKRLFLCVNGVKGFTDRDKLQSDFDLWLEEYSAAWLRDNKPSGLPRLSQFISKITDVPV